MSRLIRECAVRAVCAILSTLFATGTLAQTRTVPEFEAASVRPAKPQGRGRGGNGPWGLKFDPGLLVATNITLKELFRQAYRLKEYQLTGPDWLNSTTYDITAKSATAATPDELRLMLRKLLADRFQLKSHSETKQMEVVALRVAKNGPKFHQAEAGPPSDADGKPHTGPFGMSPMFQKLTLETLANMLSGSCGTLELPFGPVVDMTGIKGEYDLRMKTAPNPDSGGPRTLIDQVCEALPQLGLEFKREKVPVETYVIDSAERVPSEN
jgi:uncharacterized protein (TIGR03435 family)